VLPEERAHPGKIIPTCAADLQLGLHGGGV
jgi:hypothetical protein